MFGCTVYYLQRIKNRSTLNEKITLFGTNPFCNKLKFNESTSVFNNSLFKYQGSVYLQFLL